MPTYLIKHRGFFDQGAVVKAIQDWFNKKDYYIDTNFFKHSGSSYYIEMSGGRKVTEYVKFKIHVLITIDGLKNVEIIKEGKKVKTNEGHFHCTIKNETEYDWQGRFKGNKFLQGLGDFLQKYILKYKIKDYWASKATGEVNSLVQVVKNALGQEI